MLTLRSSYCSSAFDSPKEHFCGFTPNRQAAQRTTDDGIRFVLTNALRPMDQAYASRLSSTTTCPTVGAFLRVADDTDEGPGGDSQKPVVNDKVLYHSLLGLASGERFGHLSALRGLLNRSCGSRAGCRQFERNACRRRRSNNGLLLQTTGGNMAQTVADLMWRRI